MSHRIERVNSLLRQVISEVIHRELRNPDLAPHITVSSVETAKDLANANVTISIIGTDQERARSIKILNQAAGFISSKASKEVSLRQFPKLHFKLDETVEKQAKIDDILRQIHEGNPPNQQT